MSKVSLLPAQANQLWKRLEDIKHLKIDLAAPGFASTSKGRFYFGRLFALSRLEEHANLPLPSTSDSTPASMTTYL